MEPSNLITMSRLGGIGRWGNQVIQYAFLRTYARRYGLQYQTRPWIGQTLMGHQDPPMTVQLPKMIEKREPHLVRNPEGKVTGQHPNLGLSYPPEGDGARRHDFEGYCQFHTSYYAPDKEFIQSLFVPVEGIRAKMAPALDILRGRGTTIIGLHMRRGDTGRFVFYVTPNQWYLRWLEEHWSRFDNPVLFIASEEPEDYKDFTKYRPTTSRELLGLTNEPYPVYNYLPSDRRHPTPIQMDWFPDWYLLCHCDVLAMANSTFSFTAAMLSTSLKEVWRSRLSTQQFHPLDPWNDRPMEREDLRQFSGIPGTGRRGWQK